MNMTSGWAGSTVTKPVSQPGSGNQSRSVISSERASTGDRKRAAILLAAVYPVGIAVIGGNFVDLGRFLVVPRTPGLTTIETDRCPLIAAVHDMVRVSGINPPLIRVVTSGRPFESDQRMATIGGSVDTGTHRIDDIRIMRIYQNLFARCINRLGGQRPTRATVVRPIKTCAVQQIYALGMSADCDCSLARVVRAGHGPSTLSRSGPRRWTCTGSLVPDAEERTSRKPLEQHRFVPP